MNERQAMNPVALFLFFITTLFLINYYELFFIVEPARATGFGKEPTLLIYIGVNFIPKLLFHVIKWLVLLGTIHTCAILMNLNKDAAGSKREILSLIIGAEFVLIVAKLFGVLNFGFIANGYTTEEYNNYYPLSLYDQDRTDLVNYLLRHFGIFDFLYMLTLSVGIKRIYSISVTRSILVLFCAYVIPLLLWSTFIRSLGF